MRAIDRDGEGGDREGEEGSSREDGPEGDLFAEIEALGALRERAGEKSDGALIAEVLGQVRGGRGAVACPAPPLGWMRRGAVTALVTVAGAAALWMVLEVEVGDDRDDAPVVAEVTAEPPPAALGGDEAPPSPPGAPVPLGQPEIPISPVSLAGAPRGGQAPPASPAPDRLHAQAPSPASADELLRRAQHLLQAGKTAEAVETYRDLVALRPGSGEAHTALVSLGQLALDQGHAEEALAYLDRYVAGGGSLLEEASFLRIEALRHLGRAAEAATAVGEFLGRYPESVHAKRLRATL